MRPGAAVAASIRPRWNSAKTFGTKLFGALFEGDVRELYRSSFSETRVAGQGLRVTLSLTGAPELLQVPWEYMYDHPSFLSISTWTPIVRYLDLPKPRRPLQVALPIRILAMVSSPNDAEAIDAQQERAKLEAALGPFIESGAIAIDWLQKQACVRSSDSFDAANTTSFTSSVTAATTTTPTTESCCSRTRWDAAGG